MSIKIIRDDFTPYLQSLNKKSSNSGLKPFLTAQMPEMKKNEQEMFRRQVFFNGFYEEDWQPLKVSTIKRRTIKQTWYGAAQSTLKETMHLFYNLLNFSTGLNQGQPAARLRVSSGQHPSGETYKQIAQKHQDGLGSWMPARPVYSWLLSTQDKVFDNLIRHMF